MVERRRSGRTSSSRCGRCSRRDHAATRARLRHEPATIRPGQRSRCDDLERARAQAAAGAASSSTRPTPTSRGETLIGPAARGAVRTCSSAARSRRPTAWPAFAPAPSSAIPRPSLPLRQVVPPYSLNVVAAAALPAALADRDYLRLVSSPRRSESRALLYGRLRAARPALPGRARRTSCSSRVGRARCRASSRRSPRAASSSAIARAIPGATGCIRITTGVVERHASGWSPRWRRSCAARHDNRRRDDAKRRSRLTLDDRRTRPLRRLDRHPLPRSHARALRPARRLRSRRSQAKGDLDVDQHHTVEDIGIALGEAVSAALGDRRGINRAGYFVMPMDETLAVAAVDLGGRPHAVVDLEAEGGARSATCRPSWCRTSSKASRRARAPTST